MTFISWSSDFAILSSSQSVLYFIALKNNFVLLAKRDSNELRCPVIALILESLFYLELFLKSCIEKLHYLIKQDSKTTLFLPSGNVQNSTPDSPSFSPKIEQL